MLSTTRPLAYIPHQSIRDLVIRPGFFPSIISCNRATSNEPPGSKKCRINHNRFTNAHETSAAEDFAVALACGDADFKVNL
jgi:hypothetical protein